MFLMFLIQRFFLVNAIVLSVLTPSPLFLLSRFIDFLLCFLLSLLKTEADVDIVAFHISFRELVYF